MKAAKRILAVGLLGLAAVAAVLFLRPPAAAHLLLEDAHAAALEDESGSVAVFLTIANAGGPDRLVGVSSPVAAEAVIVGPGRDGLAIPAGSTPALAPDGAWLRLTGLDGPRDEGRLIPVTLEFEETGVVTTQARIEGHEDQGEAHHYGLFGLGDICVAEEGEPAPAIALSAEPAGDGWQVRVETVDFTFSEDLADGLHIPGTGHGHLYLDGLKLGRLYAPEARIGALPPGRHEITVTLNTNDHRAYVVDDEPVTASVMIEVP